MPKTLIHEEGRPHAKTRKLESQNDNVDHTFPFRHFVCSVIRRTFPFRVFVTPVIDFTFLLRAFAIRNVPRIQNTGKAKQKHTERKGESKTNTKTAVRWTWVKTVEPVLGEVRAKAQVEGTHVNLLVDLAYGVINPRIRH